jgi:uncharacterized membrane protein YbhN (UPF0104 family)
LTQTKPIWRARLKRLLPWLGTGVLLAYMATTTDLKTIGNSLAEVNIVAVILLAALGTLATFLIDSYCVAKAFSRFVCKVSYREALPIKATSYFLNILNYNLALVGMAFYLKKSRQAPFWNSLGSLFFLNVMDILTLCVLLCIGLAATQGTGVLDTATEVVAWLMAAGGFGGFALVVLMLKLDLRVPFVSKLLRLQMLAPLADLDFITVIHFLGLRAALLLTYLGSQYILLQLFGIDVPLLSLVVYNSLITFVQIIPISVAGLGTVQVVMRHFYAPYVVQATKQAAAVVDAYSTTSIFSFVLFRVVVAYFFLGEFSREIIRDAEHAAPGDVEDPSPESQSVV